MTHNKEAMKAIYQKLDPAVRELFWQVPTSDAEQSGHVSKEKLDQAVSDIIGENFQDDLWIRDSKTWFGYNTQVNRMSKTQRVLATGGKQRIYWLHMVCFEMVLYHNEPH